MFQFYFFTRFGIYEQHRLVLKPEGEFEFDRVGLVFMILHWCSAGRERVFNLNLGVRVVVVKGCEEFFKGKL